MHLAIANFWLLGQTGARPPVELAPFKQGINPDTIATKKIEVMKWLKDSIEAVRQTYPKADRAKRVTFYGKQVPAEQVFLRILVHNHEHMGQAVAYARSSGVVPPWSKLGARE